MARKIIQIAATEAGAENGYSRFIMALCEDGTLWEKELSKEAQQGADASPWRGIAPIPDQQ